MILRSTLFTAFFAFGIFFSFRAQSDAAIAKREMTAQNGQPAEMEKAMKLALLLEKEQPDSALNVYNTVRRAGDKDMAAKASLRMAEVLLGQGEVNLAQWFLDQAENATADYWRVKSMLAKYQGKQDESFSLLLEGATKLENNEDAGKAFNLYLVPLFDLAKDSADQVQVNELATRLKSKMQTAEEKWRVMALEGLSLAQQSLLDSAMRTLALARNGAIEARDSALGVWCIEQEIKLALATKRADSLKAGLDTLQAYASAWGNLAQSWSIHRFLAQHHASLGKWTECAAEWEQVLNLSPTNLQRLEALTALLSASQKQANAASVEKWTDALEQFRLTAARAELERVTKWWKSEQGLADFWTAKAHEAEKENQEQSTMLMYALIGAGVVVLAMLIVMLVQLGKKSKAISELEENLEKTKEHEASLESSGVQREGEVKKKESELSKLRALVEQQESEMRMLAKEVNEGVAVWLSKAKISADQLAREAGNSLPVEGYMQLKNSLTKAGHETRIITQGLIPEELENKGLMEALRSHCEDVSSSGLKVDFAVAGQPFVFDHLRNVAVYRIVREILHNSIKHSDATQASVNVQFLDREMLLVVKDNGQGFDVNTSIGRGSGLKGIIARVTYLRGELDVESSAQKGTVYSIKLR